MTSQAHQSALDEARRLYGGITQDMEWAILGSGRVPTCENTPGWYFEPGGPYYVPKSHRKPERLDILHDRIAEPVTPSATRPAVHLRLSKFDMAMIRDDSVVLCVGRRDASKYIIKDLLWHKQHFPIGTVISTSEGANAFYSKFIPTMFIHEEFNTNIIGNVLKRQDAIMKQILKDHETHGTSAVDRRAFVVMDDCMYDDKWLSDRYIRSLFTNNRYFGLLTILAVQYVMGIPPVLRGQVDYVFISHENQVASRKRIYEQFAGFFPTFELFCQIMDQCTENQECLVIHNSSKTNRIEDCVFWYKAAPHPDFTIGSHDHWAKSAEYERQKELVEESAITDEDEKVKETLRAENEQLRNEIRLLNTVVENALGLDEKFNML